MLSQFEIDKSIDLKSSTFAQVVGKATFKKAKDTAKLYIPTLMEDISVKSGKPKTKTSGRITNSIFCNAKACKPKVSKKVIKEKNYLTGIFKDNSSIKAIKKNVKNKDGEVVSYHIPNGKKVRCQFVGQKVSKLHFDTNIT